MDDLPPCDPAHKTDAGPESSIGGQPADAVGSDDATATPMFLVTAEGEMLGEDSPANREIVRRIRACVNACEGLTTADLENGIVSQMVRLVSDLTPLLTAAESHPLAKAS